jgi:hypothetical protein
VGGDRQLIEKDARHLGIKMLTGVQDDFLNVDASGDRARNCRRLDELRPGADHRQHPEALHSSAEHSPGPRRGCWNMQRKIGSRMGQVRAMVATSPSRNAVAAVKSNCSHAFAGSPRSRGGASWDIEVGVPRALSELSGATGACRRRRSPASLNRLAS